MIRIIYESDVFADKYSNYALAHQVNCRGVMGSGIAKQVKERFPEVFAEYHKLCSTSNQASLLGDFQIVKTPHRIAPVVNLFGQMDFGYNGHTYTDYQEFANSLAGACKELKTVHNTNKVVMPYRIGCCRGGGNWESVLHILSLISEKGEMDFLLVSNRINQELRGETW